MHALRIQDWSLKYKVIFHMFIIGLISGSLLLLIYINSVRSVAKAMNSRKMSLVGAIIGDHIQHALSMGHPPAIGPSLADVAAASTVASVRIIDTEGRILHSSAEESAGTFVPAQERKRLKSYFADPSKGDADRVTMASMGQGYLPIEKKPECLRCHRTGERFVGILDVKFDMSEEARVLATTRKIGLGLAVLTMIVLSLVTYRLYARVIDKPLTRLMGSMRRVESGDFSARLSFAKKDEFGTLAQSFNAMTARLEEISGEVARHHELQMQKAGHLASLGELAAGLAHEIRNPIAGIRGAAEVIAQMTSPGDPRREVFDEIRKQADRINVIIQNLLNFARPRELTLKRENPNACVRAALLMAEHQTEGKDVRFHFDPVDEDVLADLDCDKIQEVLLNLLLNGIAAIEKEGRISVAMAEKEGDIELRVEDTGKGIAPEHLPLIFNPFFTTRKKGTGLGLSLCRQIIQAHGGTITAESEPGRGTAFTIRLPAAKAEQGR